MKSIIQKIKISAVTLALLVTPLFVLAGVANAQPDIEGSLCQGGDQAQLADGGSCANVEGEDQLNDLITNIVNILSLIVGIVAVVMIIVGGFKYITSGGDSGNVSGAKNTILYALVGLVIVALAQFIVRFVLSKSTDLT
jgi:hypothetical protein